MTSGNAITEGARVRWRKGLHSYLGHIVDAQPDGHGRVRVATDRGAVVPIQVERLEVLSQPAAVVPLTRTPRFDSAPLRAVPKITPVRDESYLGWLRTLPCCVCGLEGSTEASHHGQRGMATKASDHEALPLCSDHHRRWHGKAASPHPSWDLLDRQQMRDRLSFYAGQYRELYTRGAA